MRIGCASGQGRRRSFPLAANISLLFTEVPMLDRPAAAAAAGFEAIEGWWPFDGPTPSRRDVDAFLAAVDDAGVALIGMNLFAGDMAAGERGVLSDPSRIDEFADALRVAADVARRTGCGGFNALYGQRLPTVDPAEQDRVATRNLAEAVRTLGELGGVVLVEPLSRGLNGAYPLETAAEALAVVHRVREAAGRDEIALLFDTFHLANNGEDLVGVIRRHVADIGHVQLADSPGRGEPGSGSVDFAGVLAALCDGGYDGSIALEYVPTSSTDASLAEVSAFAQVRVTVS